MKVMNFGSLNLDYVYQVDHFVQPGETLAASARSVKAGGKGLNQSIALKRAGAETLHAGCLGEGGDMLKRLLKENGVDVTCLKNVPEMQGHAVIQVNSDGENCILLYAGSNHAVTKEQIVSALSLMEKGDWLVLQNEINLLDEIVKQARQRSLVIVLNPSPYNEALDAVDFALLDWLLVNEVEAGQITGHSDPDQAFQWLHARYPGLSVLITLGSLGSVAYRVDGSGAYKRAQLPARHVRAVDTTAAGDTYTGYFVSGLMRGLSLADSMDRATAAAAVSVTRMGAADSIPRADELDDA